jgi:hypothetical protein
MLKFVVAGVTALFVTASPLALAQVPSAMGPEAPKHSGLGQIDECTDCDRQGRVAADA